MSRPREERGNKEVCVCVRGMTGEKMVRKKQESEKEV